MSSVNPEIRELCRSKGITRLCHFTKSCKLPHILGEPGGLIASSQLRSESSDTFDPTDANRYDGRPECVCLSIEYPNVYYMRKAKKEEHVFLDWVVVTTMPDSMWLSDTEYCHRNAAADHGAHVRMGTDGFNEMFAARVTGAGGRTFSRSNRLPAFCPTDNQAEVLVKHGIPRRMITGLIVHNDAQARDELARIKMACPGIIGLPPIFVCRTLFEPDNLISLLNSGVRPVESVYNSGAA